MSRRPIPPPVAIALSLLLIALTVRLWLGKEEQAPKATAPSDRSDSHHLAPGSSDERIDSLSQRASDDPAGPSHAIPNEHILTFANEADYRRFIASEYPNITLIAQNDTLRSARVRAAANVDLRTLAPDAQADANYTLLTPLPILTDTLAADKAFGNSALSFVNGLNSTDAGSGIKVAVLDTGIRNHATLDPERVQQFGNVTPQDYLSHGTAVASLIAGQEGVGIAPQAELIGIQVLDTDGIGDAYSLATAIVQAVDSGANIINMSLGTYGSNQALANAVAYADGKGVVLVASAGNESVTALPYPAAYESVIAVSSIDSEGHPTSFANQSDAVDIAAPGVGVYAAWEDDKWVSFTGTSASAPYVSGAIAALSSQLEIPASEAANILLANANDSGLPGPDSQLGRGYIDLQRSLNSNTSYTDLALSDIYLVSNRDDNEQYTIYLTAQNRGTQSIPAATLNYTLPNGITQEVYLGSLQPGETASHSLAIVQSALELGYKISAQTEFSSYRSDTNPQNDSRKATLTAPEE